MGAVLREQNALPYEAWTTYNLTAKDDVDNVGAGRAAKGANPASSSKNNPFSFGSGLFFYRQVRPVAQKNIQPRVGWIFFVSTRVRTIFMESDGVELFSL